MIRGLIQTLLHPVRRRRRRRRSDHPHHHHHRTPSALSDPQPHRQSDAGDEAARLDSSSHTLRVSLKDLTLFLFFFFLLAPLATTTTTRKRLYPRDVGLSVVGLLFFTLPHVFLSHFQENWVMSTSPTVSVLRNSTNPAWESCSSGEKGAAKISQQSAHNSVSPADPSRQASRLPIKVLKMLTARAGHLLHPEYLQPLPSTPISPIEVRTRQLGGLFCDKRCQTVAILYVRAAIMGWTLWTNWVNK